MGWERNGQIGDLFKIGCGGKEMERKSYLIIRRYLTWETGEGQRKYRTMGENDFSLDPKLEVPVGHPCLWSSEERPP